MAVVSPDHDPSWFTRVRSFLNGPLFHPHPPKWLWLSGAVLFAYGAAHPPTPSALLFMALGIGLEITD